MILVLAGTQDGRIIAETLANKGFETWATTVTSYGGELINNNVNIRTGPLNKKELMAFLREKSINTVIDATHPFAQDISVMAIEVCSKMRVKYLRFERKSTDKIPCKLIKVKQFDDALKAVEKYDRLFLTIGSKNLDKFTGLLHMDKKLIARVLPQSSILKKCENLGFTPENIIAMKGPFTTQMNYLMFKEFKAEVIVTKDSGITGGVSEKLKAASKLNIPVVFIERPAVDYPLVVRDLEKVYGFFDGVK